ncbi:hypothetical protein HY946_00020, partial [Candidatus Gottesmanbacteria bacterium]|nr:hypothetical protein [Candidatus Gottesmanbacteria bacterium]
MRKIFIVSLFNCFIVLLLAMPVLAVKPEEATPPGKRIEERREQIKELRERVATRVTE